MGNCAILKPSEIAPYTSRVVADIIQKHFDPAYITVVGVETSQQLLAEKLDHIFLLVAQRLAKCHGAAKKFNTSYSWAGW